MSEPLTHADVTVLLVDDEANILRSLERLLMDEEFTVLTATSGEEGLEVLKSASEVALIVSDQRMPGMGGAEFLAAARDITPEAIRMILTGYADVNAAMDAINKGGAARYLSKPWEDNMLVQAIRDGVDHYLMVRENQRLQEIVQQQHDELQEWNVNLKKRVLEQTTVIRTQNEDLAARNARIREAFDGTIQAFSRLVELCSTRLLSHARNVTDLSMAIARELNLPAEEQETLRVAAQLHDIGVIGIPETILAKRTSEMTQEEINIYKQHSVRGQAALDAVEALRPAAQIIRHHHEQFNGNGYPDGLRKDEIPLGSRIIAFADFIDREMQSDRSVATLEMVLQKMNLHLGMSLDPQLAASVRKCAKYTYLNFESRPSGSENEYPPHELVAGMLVTRDVYSGTGLMLLNRGTVLDRQKVESLRRYYEIDPPRRGVYAIIKKAEQQP